MRQLASPTFSGGGRALSQAPERGRHTVTKVRGAGAEVILTGYETALVPPLPDKATASLSHLLEWLHSAGARTQRRGDADASPEGGVVLEELRARKRRREGAASS